MELLLIDGDGELMARPYPSFVRAVFELGYVCIKGTERWVLFCFNPKLVNPVTMAGAFLELAIWAPKRTFVWWPESPTLPMFTDYVAAMDKITHLVQQAGQIEPSHQDYKELLAEAREFERTHVLRDC